MASGLRAVTALWLALQLIRVAGRLIRWSGTEPDAVKADAEPVVISRMPEDAGEALALLKEMGYDAASVWRIEEDRILAVDAEGEAFTVRFQFSDEDVRSELVAGWPL